jgi:hypothetical protein
VKNKDIFMHPRRRSSSMRILLDRQGNVLSRAVYEDLARQGLL